MAEDLKPEEVADAKAAASVVAGLTDLTEGGVLLPRFIKRGEDGLYVDISLLESGRNFLQFVDRVFAADAMFTDLDYALFTELLYDCDDPAQLAKDAGRNWRLARDIISFPPERKALYHDVRVPADGSAAEYLFEAVTLDEEYEEPVYGPPAEDGSKPIVGQEKRLRQVPTQLDPDEFVAAMWDKGIRYGLDMEAVRTAIAENRRERLQIAHRRDPLAGTDAGIAEQTDLLHRDDTPVVLSNGRIDLRQFKNRFPQVSADTCLLKKNPRVDGEHGWDVRGATIEPPVPKDFEIETLAGPGTKIERNAEGEFIVAAMSGFINIDARSNQISISEKIINTKGVSLRTTGDLSLAGADFEEHGEVQERRQVRGHNMTFLAGVFGEILSDGGVITLKDSLAGGSAQSPNGKIVLERNASRATIDAKGGEIVIAVAESCMITASKVNISRAVNCDIVGEEVDIESCEGCAVAGKVVHVGNAASRRDAESVITVMLPDNSAWDTEIQGLEAKLAEAANARAEREKAAAVISDKPGAKDFLTLQRKIEAREIAITAEQQAGWQSAQNRFAPVVRQLAALDREIAEIREREASYSEQKAALEAEKAQAAAQISCVLDVVSGDTVVRKMIVSAAGFPLADLPAKELRKVLRSHGTRHDRLFSGAGGSFGWPKAPEGESPPKFDPPETDG